LLSNENIRQAVVTTTKDNGEKKQLCAYLSGDRRLPVAEIRRHLTQFLPEYMVPNHFTWLEALPLTPNGKIDRRSLPEPSWTDEGTDSYLPPENPMEETLVRLWAEVLGITRVGIDDDFFALGGDSLDILQILSDVLHNNGSCPLRIFMNTRRFVSLRKE
jgi:hypothetical protein